jgi:1-acyl-sn-glycerol-3-phosphate acyltransferase
VEIIGKERIPQKGGCIIVANHLGRLDALLVYTKIARQDVVLTLAEKYQKVALFRWAAKSLDAIWLDRFNSDIKALRSVIKRIKHGELFVIAPEGTRSQAESLIEGRHGAAYIATKTGVPVIPVALTGTEDRIIKEKLLRWQRSKVVITIGDPFVIQPIGRENRDIRLQANTDEIMCQIAALLPSQYRGIYADHPRLQQLLSTRA